MCERKALHCALFFSFKGVNKELVLRFLAEHTKMSSLILKKANKTICLSKFKTKQNYFESLFWQFCHCLNFCSRMSRHIPLHFQALMLKSCNVTKKNALLQQKCTAGTISIALTAISENIKSVCLLS